MAGPKKETRPDRVRSTRWFLHDAFADYIAARVLILGGLLKQAAILSSTAIEKCAKAVLALRGNTSWGHFNIAHWNVLENESRLAHLLDRDFVKLNENAYSLRYTDDLPIDFNLVIASRKFLAEMDHTVLSALSCFKVDESGRHRPTDYEVAIQKGDERLIAENHLISRVPLEQFIYAKPQFVYEVRRDPLRGLVEATYATDKPAKTAGFLRPGLFFEVGSRERFESSHFPMSGTFSLFAEGSELVGSELSQL